VSDKLEKEFRQLRVVARLQEKKQKQRNEIARLTQKLAAATKENKALLADIKWMRGEKA
tara:strand:+ start:181 stop:357 length:177 start_codon:yes stop_codon:yes gene_type:complete